MGVQACSGPALWVATNLAVREVAHPERCGGDIWYRGLVYRDLDPVYYAWLRGRLTVARRAREAGKVSPEAHQELVKRFQVVHEHAVARFDVEALRGGARSLDPTQYRPPGLPHLDWLEWPDKGSAKKPSRESDEHRFSSKCGSSHIEPVTPDAMASVDAIRKTALAAGWTESELCQNQGRHPFPFGSEYGLVCFLGRGRSIGTVGSEAIEVLCPGGHALRFRRRHPKSSDTLPEAPVCNPRDPVPTEEAKI